MTTVTNHDRLLAREVIIVATRRYASNQGPDFLDFDTVIRERWPARGTGGVAMSQRRTITQVQAAIREFYEPPDHSPEPQG